MCCVQCGAKRVCRAEHDSWTLLRDITGIIMGLALLFSWEDEVLAPELAEKCGNVAERGARGCR